MIVGTLLAFILIFYTVSFDVFNSVTKEYSISLLSFHVTECGDF